jgi:hypothetical protein
VLIVKLNPDGTLAFDRAWGTGAFAAGVSLAADGTLFVSGTVDGNTAFVIHLLASGKVTDASTLGRPRRLHQRRRRPRRRRHHPGRCRLHIASYVFAATSRTSSAAKGTLTVATGTFADATDAVSDPSQTVITPNGTTTFGGADAQP